MIRRRGRALTALAVPAVLAMALGAAPLAAATSPGSPPAPVTVPGSPAAAPATPAPALPLSGVVVAIDPGHQLGNANPRFASKLAQTRWNGTITKGCNTTGTATNGGFPEATFTWRVATRLKARLEALGATVPMTRTANSFDLWGPCTWNRGRFGAEVGADLMVSIHADGSAPGGRGFFIIAPGNLKGWTDDIYRSSRRLADDMIAGMAAAGAQRSTYISGSLLVWKDQNTLNFSDVPTVIVEVGNMRNASDAARMTTTRGQRQYADWLLAGIREHLGR